MSMQPEKKNASAVGAAKASSVETTIVRSGINMDQFTQELAFGHGGQQTFNFGGYAIRVVTRDGEPWFVASDVAMALGYRDAANAGRTLKERQKGTHSVSTPGGLQKLMVINEPGLYKLVLRSRKPDAEQFQDWVTEDVLPSIRKTGSYEKPAHNHEQVALARRAALLATAEVYQSVFDAVMQAKDWQLNRYMLSFDVTAKEGTAARVKPIERNACVLPIGRFHDAIEDSITVDAATLTRLVNTCTDRLGRMAQRAAYKAIEVAA